MPLLLVLVMGKVLKKLFVETLLGNKLPLHVGAAPAVHPAKAKLTLLTGTPAVCNALIASTMLDPGPAPAPV